MSFLRIGSIFILSLLIWVSNASSQETLSPISTEDPPHVLKIKIKETLSNTPDFESIYRLRKSGKFGRFGKSIATNSNLGPTAESRRSFQKYLQENAYEYFKDPEFRCRKPGTSQVLEAIFGNQLPPPSCHTPYSVLLSNSDSRQPEIVDIHPDRLSRIDFLLASKGSHLESRFGHAMFRFVFCSQDKKENTQCENDLEDHVVMSFRAKVDTASLSYMKGLTGGYASMSFFMPFLSVLTEYREKEVRDVYSIPLKLDLKQKKLFLDLALENHYGYIGKYFFFQRNCGTESKELLEAVFGVRLQSRTPISLLKSLMRKNRVDRTLAKQILGHKTSENKVPSTFFPSYEAYYQSAKKVTVGWEEKPISERKKRLESLSSTEKQKWTSAFWLLGHRDFLHLQDRIFEELKKNLLNKSDQTNDLNNTAQIIQNILKVNPSTLTSTYRYGIPLQGEWQINPEYWENREKLLNWMQNLSKESELKKVLSPELYQEWSELTQFLFELRGRV